MTDIVRLHAGEPVDLPVILTTGGSPAQLGAFTDWLAPVALGSRPLRYLPLDKTRVGDGIITIQFSEVTLAALELAGRDGSPLRFSLEALYPNGYNKVFIERELVVAPRVPRIAQEVSLD